MRRALSIPLLLLASLTALAQTAAPAAPLPDIATLLRDVELHQQANQHAAHDYLYKATRTATRTDGKTHTMEIEFVIVNGVQMHRVTARDGKPLSPDDAAREDERANREAAKARERKQKAEREGRSTDQQGEPLIPAARLLELDTVSNLHRELLHGRPTIVFQFHGNRAAKTHGVAEEIIAAAEGTAWIDEQDREMARMEADLPETFRFGWGLVVDIRKGSGITAEFAPVRDGVWLPVGFTGHGQLRRFLFSKPVDGSFSVTYSDYRKFGANVTLRPGAEVEQTTPSPMENPPAAPPKN